MLRAAPSLTDSRRSLPMPIGPPPCPAIPGMTNRWRTPQASRQAPSEETPPLRPWLRKALPRMSRMVEELTGMPPNCNGSKSQRQPRTGWSRRIRRTPATTASGVAMKWNLENGGKPSRLQRREPEVRLYSRKGLRRSRADGRPRRQRRTAQPTPAHPNVVWRALRPPSSGVLPQRSFTPKSA